MRISISSKQESRIIFEVVIHWVKNQDFYSSESFCQARTKQSKTDIFVARKNQELKKRQIENQSSMFSAQTAIQIKQTIQLSFQLRFGLVQSKQ